MIFVKLHQFDARDQEQITINTQEETWRPGLVPGLSVMPLHEFGTESVALVKWEPNTQFTSHRHLGGEEILVIDGVFHDEFGQYPKGTWLRNPDMSIHQPFTKEEGALIYVKVGHLGEKIIGTDL